MGTPTAIRAVIRGPRTLVWALAALTALTALAALAVGSWASSEGGRPSSASGRPSSASQAARVARWTAYVRVRRPLDLAGPLSDGSLALAARGRLFLLTSRGRLMPFASGRGGYRSPPGEEPYIALSPGGAFGNGSVYALRLTGARGVVRVDPSGTVRDFAKLNYPGLINGITFDGTGQFGHRLLVTVNAGSRTAVAAIDPRGVVSTITRSAPRVEGGIAVAPTTFGPFAGDLIAPSETTGQIFAVTPQGRSMLVVDSGLPHGADIGVESEAFAAADPRADAFVADRRTLGNRHPGDDAVLRIRAAALRAAGVRSGDLIVSNEGAGLTDDVSFAAGRYRVRLIARGPAIAHGEGHIAFARSG